MDNPYPKGTIPNDLFNTAEHLGAMPASEDETIRAIDGLTIAAYTVSAGLINVVAALADAVREKSN